MALYSIKEETLTGIGDALRRKYGETHKEPLYLDYVVSSSNNITSADGVNSGFSNVAYENTITIPNAVRLFVKLTYIAAEHLMPNYVFTINNTVYSTNSHTKTYSEINLDGDTVTFKYTTSGKGTHCYYAEISGYDADGNIILNDTGETVDVPNTYKSSEMAQAIDDIPLSPPEEVFVISGNCAYRFANNGWNWFLERYNNKINTKDITDAANMFYQNANLKEINFDFNFKSGNSINANNMFNACGKLTAINANFNNFKPTAIHSMFDSCASLRYLPNLENIDFSYHYTHNVVCTFLFQGCYSLRSVPETLLKKMYQPKNTDYYYSVLYSTFIYCFALDEVRGLNPQTGTIKSNLLSNTFLYCYRLKNLIFATQDDGTPYSVKWKSQTIRLSGDGYAPNLSYILDYNSGITADKEVKDDATYQALKNDPDWFTTNVAYSRYNHDSAVATINSLPDTSAYLASAGGTNTITFKGAAGSATDGGAINTLTEEEIAVATAKGWTVTLV